MFQEVKLAWRCFRLASHQEYISVEASIVLNELILIVLNEEACTLVHPFPTPREPGLTRTSLLDLCMARLESLRCWEMGLQVCH